MNNLKLKQQRFVQEYSVDGNATQAAIRAGYSPRSAYNQAYRLMNNDEVQRCLLALLEKSVWVLADTMDNAPNYSHRLKAAEISINLWFNSNDYKFTKYI